MTFKSAQKQGKRRQKYFATTPVMRRSLAYRALLRCGWTEVGESEDWDIFWADVYSVGPDSGFNPSKLRSHQRLNHFQRHSELTRKDALVKNLKRARKTLEREGKDPSVYNFFPQTYVLPQEYSMFTDEFRKAPGRFWIMKPSGRSQGQGIFLINRISQVFAWRKEQEGKDVAEPYIISKYIENPMLVGGRKFDMRLYVLVNSFAPLQIYMYRAGFCRFSCGQYSSSRLNDLTLHLTNIAIQKKQGGYNSTTGMKWPISSLRKYLVASMGAETADHTFKSIEEVVIQSLLAVQHVVTADNHCFELFGYDILLDDNLKPWLIEVNASPSLSADTPADLKLKSRMLDDTIRLVDGLDQHCSQGGFDLIWGNGQPRRTHPVLRSLMGCSLPEALTHPSSI